MRFLADQDVYAVTLKFLNGLGHDVATAAQLASCRQHWIPCMRSSLAS